MKILAIETSAVSASAALCEDDRLLAESFANIPQTHSETLMPMVGGLLRRCRMDIGDIGLFAVTAGPGSFTGVRIGVAAVKGMALPRSTPCAAVSSLEAAAFNIAGFDGIVCAVMDARCAQVYNALFDCSKGIPSRLCEDRAVSLEALKNELITYKKHVILVGDGANLCYNSLKGQCRVMLPPQALMLQRASGAAAAGYRAYLNHAAVPPDKLLPIYLRPPQAERELRRRTVEKNPEQGGR